MSNRKWNKNEMCIRDSYYADFLPDASEAILAAMLWRAIFYYTFLLMGTLVLPTWIARN